MGRPKRKNGDERLAEHKELVRSLLKQDDTYVAFADGSCIDGNPGYAGSGACLLEPNPDASTAPREAGGWRARDLTHAFGRRKATNNVAELKAVELALKLCVTRTNEASKTESKEGNRRIKKWVILTDSTYVVGLLQENWKATQNALRVAALRAELTRCEAAYGVMITLMWVKGHQGLFWNEHVDKLAREAAERSRSQSEPDSNPSIPAKAEKAQEDSKADKDSKAQKEEVVSACKKRKY
jgi:ribonuclease HI